MVLVTPNSETRSGQENFLEACRPAHLEHRADVEIRETLPQTKCQERGELTLNVLVRCTHTNTHKTSKRKTK